MLFEVNIDIETFNLLVDMITSFIQSGGIEIQKNFYQFLVKNNESKYFLERIYIILKSETE